MAVIADIVDSRGIPDRPEFQRRLDALLGRMSNRSGKHLLSPFTITLGDNFQAVYGGFEAVLGDAVEIIAAVYPLRLRMALGHGPLSTDLNPTAALGMDGPCFAAAGSS
ncbi:MAG: SatD family protein [Spirochaetota bacterium]